MGSARGLLNAVLLFCTVSAAVAATCNFNTENAISPADIANLAIDVGSNSFNPPLENPMEFTGTSTKAVGRGTAQFCIRNSFLFESTHISLSDIQFGAEDILSQCCLGPTCQGGQFTIRGDDGITVILNVQPVDQDCDV